MASETSRPPQEVFTSPGNIISGQSMTCDSVPMTDIAVDIRQSDVAPVNTTQTHNTDLSSLQHSNLSNAQTQVRSIFGRLVKPANRLIQSMSRQNVVRDNFSVKSVCKSIFHSLVE